MAVVRKAFDGRLVTHCDACGRAIVGDAFVGSHGLTELLGIGFCRECAEADKVDFPLALLKSGLLSADGVRAVGDWMQLQDPPARRTRNLATLLSDGRLPNPADPSRWN